MSRVLAPTTAEYLAFHARHRPEAEAVISWGRSVSYREFDLHVGRFTNALAHLCLPPGSTAAVEAMDGYTHWVMILALENLGVCTATFYEHEVSEAVALLESVDLVFWSSPIRGCTVKREFRIPHSWLDEVAARGEAAELPSNAPSPHIPAPDDPIRIVRSSGTTGRQKRMIKTRHMNDGKVWQSQLFKPCAAGHRHLFEQHFSVNNAYASATACLRMGATVILGDLDRNLLRAIAKYKPDVVHTMPAGMQVMLQQLPPDFEKPDRLILSSTGGSVGPQLRRSLLARLASEVIDTFGSNETGSICLVDEQGVGTVLPGVEVELLDDSGAPLTGAGESGRLRVRTAIMSHAYLDDPDATAAMFRDGWFHTGDIAKMLAPGRLKLLGRADEVFNLNGLKVAAAALEANVLAHAAMSGADAAFTSITNAEDVEELCLALTGPRRPELVRELAAGLPPGLGPIRLNFLWLERIPRNAAGKVQRHLLKEQFQQSSRR